MSTIRNRLRDRSNDYSHHEIIYRKKMQSELVSQPMLSHHSLDLTITKTATVVIAAWNCGHSIAIVLRAIENSTFNQKYPTQLDVVVIDDGSTDSTWSTLENLKLNLNVRCLRQENTGQYRALNTAFSQAMGDVIISIDDDMILAPHAIEELMKRHEVLDDVLLIGFRYDIPRNEATQYNNAFREKHEQMPAKFYADNRLTFHWHGYPRYFCAATNHLKSLNGMQRIWVTDGEQLDGDFWTLPRMVYGALFSLPRHLLLAMDGYDEDFLGWGWGDTVIGIKAYALGANIIPVYSALGQHIEHLDRSTSKWDEADRNYELLQQLLDQEVVNRRVNNIASASRRILKDHTCQWQTREQSSTMATQYLDEFYANNKARICLVTGDYEGAVMAYNAVFPHVHPVDWASHGYALLKCSNFDYALSVLQQGCAMCPTNGMLRFHLALAYTWSDDSIAANALIKDCEDVTLDDGWWTLVNMPASSYVRRAKKSVDEKLFSFASTDLLIALMLEPDNHECRMLYDNIQVKISE